MNPPSSIQDPEPVRPIGPAGAPGQWTELGIVLLSIAVLTVILVLLRARLRRLWKSLAGHRTHKHHRHRHRAPAREHNGRNRLSHEGTHQRGRTDERESAARHSAG